MIPHLNEVTTTADVRTPKDPFERIVGQQHAVKLVRSAVKQRRHVLLCGVPGTGKSLIAKAAYSLLPPPKEEIVLRPNPKQPDRPLVIVSRPETNQAPHKENVNPESVEYIHPDELPFDVAIEMGYRCQRCGAFSYPSQENCMDCGVPKRHDVTDVNAYSGLFRVLDVIREPALRSTQREVVWEGAPAKVVYERTSQDMIRVSVFLNYCHQQEPIGLSNSDYVLISRNASRFVRISGSSPVELLGDVKHDPYGIADNLATAPHMRVVPGGVHEAHEGILFVDEIGALGPYQKHLLTAMQDKYFPITGHNPLSSGASVRVDKVPCDFILFAACNLDDIPKIHPALRSRIRGYGYEIMLASWFDKSRDHMSELIKFMAITIEDDGRIPHLDRTGIDEVLRVAEQMALKIDGQRSAYTLRLRELGGIIRIAGDVAVQEDASLIEGKHVKSAESLSQSLGADSPLMMYEYSPRRSESFGDYFF